MWLLNKHDIAPARSAPKLRCRRDLWLEGVAELRRRTLGSSRESGAFLLGRQLEFVRQIERFAFYDDLDPHALDSGIVTFHGVHYPKLWDICQAENLTVVADVHVHPGSYNQSPSDKSQPAMPRAGHIALIIPVYAMRRVEPGGIGQYEYLGEQRWKNQTSAGSQFFLLD